MANVVVFMETSGTVRDAFARLGHNAISVDLLPAQNGGPHHQGDAFEYALSRNDIDLAIWHPECTFHAVSAAWALHDPDYDRYPGVGYHQRVKPGTPTGAARRRARMFAEWDVERIRWWPIKRKVIENPRGTLTTRTTIGKPFQVVQPYEFGHDASKATCLWAFDDRGEPLTDMRLALDPAQYVPPTLRPNGTYRWANQTDTGQNRLSPHVDRWQTRSDTYTGIARAMAEQWSRLLE